MVSSVRALRVLEASTVRRTLMSASASRASMAAVAMTTLTASTVSAHQVSQEVTVRFVTSANTVTQDIQ